MFPAYAGMHLFFRPALYHSPNVPHIRGDALCRNCPTWGGQSYLYLHPPNGKKHFPERMIYDTMTE